jgi:hypothetical protein
MSFKAIRSFLSVFMIAAFVVSLLPVTYASQAGQSAQTIRARRGKNGGAASNVAAPQETNRSEQAAESQPEPATSNERARQGNNSTGVAKDQTANPKSQNEARRVDASIQPQDLQDRGSQDRTGSQNRSEPPPFDRPPLTTGRGAQNNPVPDAPKSSVPPNSGPPVLRRPPATDSRTPDSSRSDGFR